MALHFDDDLWGDVRVDTWKYRRRTVAPTLIELHCTRSGITGRTAAQDYQSTMSWFLSDGNKNPAGNDDWASMASYIVGGGRLCRVLPEDFWPHYSLGHADHLAFSVEIAQATNDTPFEGRDLENAAELCAHLSETYDIPVRVLSWLSGDNHEAPGYVRHDRSANGAKWGKTDPGRLFVDSAFEGRVMGHMGMTPAELARLDKLAKDLVAEQKETKRWRTFAEAVIGLHQGRLDAQDGWNAMTEATLAALHPEGAPE